MIIQNGLISKALIKLIELTGLKVADESPKAVNDLLQKEWFKTSSEQGTLRCEIGGRLPNKEEYLLLGELGFLEDIMPDPAKNYNPPIFLGATMKAMARRIQFLKGRLWFPYGDKKPAYFLVGQRPLNEKLEGKHAVPSILEETGLTLDEEWCNIPESEWPKTETEVAEFLIRYSGVNVECHVVDMPKDGNILPNTYNTTVELFKTVSSDNPNYLVISSQPYCQNQLLTVMRAAAEAGVDAKCDVCGPSAPTDLPLARILDCISKQLWEEVQYL